MAVFLTDEWFEQVDNLTQEAGELNLPPALADMTLNVTVNETSNGEVQAHLADGVLKKGSTDTDTTVITTEETLKQVAMDGDMNEAMQAFMSGKIRIEGDMSKLMTLQSVKPSQEQKELFKKIHAMTEYA